ncbi:hypothetical protein VSH64_24425 [Amycolatopsis rhabdoformis]|uniref:DUF3885 domain-containing protein n=1 Tax=Amycolatopsis rhabdoformis TaxID=1448059 RepID=A0ABZ1HWU4_9PSEU|nr:hypothetical protein [Amycolatopsis rhabdoformis]WSE26027.1 hypothetical protein VSH64_24425 [Amycolatopsis rhabdoformis]
MANDSELSALWRQRWPDCDPISYTLKSAYPDRWVRFHSLPESKRYPETEAEYDLVLGRYNVVLDELFGGQEVRIVTNFWSDDPEPPAEPAPIERRFPGARHWMSVCDDEDETDPDFISYAHVYAGRTSWRSGLIDDTLRAVADDAAAGVMITSLSFDRIHAPYDGGADVLLPTTAERDALKQRYSEWLSRHPQGL